MVQRYLPRSSVADGVLVPALDRIRVELGVPADFPADVADHANRAVAQWQEFVATIGPRTPDPRGDAAPDAGAVQTLPDLGAPEPSAAWDALDARALPTLDATHIPLVTIDPPGSRDLDQAVHLLRLPGGQADGATHLVTYAIASLATFIPRDSPLDREARARGLTTYFPDVATPLHPRVLSEGAASLLPGQLAPAWVWQIRLGPDGKRGVVAGASCRGPLPRAADVRTGPGRPGPHRPGRRGGPARGMPRGPAGAAARDRGVASRA